MKLDFCFFFIHTDTTQIHNLLQFSRTKSEFDGRERWKENWEGRKNLKKFK